MVARDRRKREQFARMALPHMDRIYTTGLYLTRNREEAEELLQETFLRAYRFWHQFTPGTNCKAWLMKILHNTFKNRYRERCREQLMVEFDEALYDQYTAVAPRPLQDNPEDIVFSQLLDSEVEAALKSLPVEFLEVVLLVDVHELTYEEAASTVECPIGTVRSRLSRGRRLLHEALKDYARERGYGRRNTYAVR
ncbi:MAG: sigma-70 family RNA polymerase sigma factor [Candidatus Binatia bacterium]